jgi:hypothetical protein
MTIKTLKKVKSQKKSKSQLRKTRKVRKHRANGGDLFSAVAKATRAEATRAAAYTPPISHVASAARKEAGRRASRGLRAAVKRLPSAARYR